jgi:hypothetical protein
MRAEFLWVKLKEAEHLENLTQLEGCGLDYSGSGWGLVLSSCENSNETLFSIK